LTHSWLALKGGIVTLGMATVIVLVTSAPGGGGGGPGGPGGVGVGGEGGGEGGAGGCGRELRGGGRGEMRGGGGGGEAVGGGEGGVALKAPRVDENSRTPGSTPCGGGLRRRTEAGPGCEHRRDG
jgi:hypothetical protein